MQGTFLCKKFMQKKEKMYATKRNINMEKTKYSTLCHLNKCFWRSRLNNLIFKFSSCVSTNWFNLRLFTLHNDLKNWLAVTLIWITFGNSVNFISINNVKGVWHKSFCLHLSRATFTLGVLHLCQQPIFTDVSWQLRRRKQQYMC